ncbi:TPA: toxin [Bacillus cereus]|uniref:toxin n=1 Tax=Bacillus thuringiensis TaxID=1428 RepID=UPI0020D202D9|nr:toxin [Bacillus thuringiensis]
MESKVVKGKVGKGNSDLLDNIGRFKDAELQTKYDVYCERKYKNGESPKEPLEWKEASEKWASLKEQGQEFSDESFNLFSQQYENAQREITIVTNEGTKVRVDAIASDEYGNVIIQEYKSSATAPYTTNQEKGFPELKNSGGAVVGEGKGDFSGGYEVPSGTRPQIVRPEGTTYFDE